LCSTGFLNRLAQPPSGNLLQNVKKNFGNASAQAALSIVRWVAILGCTALSLFPSKAGEFTVEAIQLTNNREIRLDYTSSDGYYYVFWRSEDLRSENVPLLMRFPATLDPNTFSNIIPDETRRAFYTITESSYLNPGDADGDGIDDLYETIFEHLSPFKEDDAIEKNEDGITHLEQYNQLQNLIANPPYSEPGKDTGEQRPNSAPAPLFDLSQLIGVDVVNKAGSDYTAGIDNIGNLRSITLEGPTVPGYQYPGTYYFGVSNHSVGERPYYPTDISYEIDSTGLVSTAVLPDRQDYPEAVTPLYYRFGSPGGNAVSTTLEFGADPGIEVISNDAVQTVLVDRGGVGDSGYLQLTDATPDSNATVILPDDSAGAPVTSFRLTVDIRMGGGTANPGEELFLGVARARDPLLHEPKGSGEKGLTGLSVFFSGNSLSVRIDGRHVAGYIAPTDHGTIGDPTSLQTGLLNPIDPLGALGWARLEVALNDNGLLRINWKGKTVIEKSVEWRPSPVRLIASGSTSQSTRYHHLDNLQFDASTTPSADTSLLDFESDPNLEVIANQVASAGIEIGGGVGDSNFLALTGTGSNARSVIVLPDLAEGNMVSGFELSFDARVGGSQFPDGGMSVNLVRQDDDVLLGERGSGFAALLAPGFVFDDVIEEGTDTGLSIGIDYRSDGTGDIAGISVWLDRVLLAEVEAATINGNGLDPTSLQTGPFSSQQPEQFLGWARFNAKLDQGQFTLSWKGSTLINIPIEWPGFSGRFVVGANNRITGQIQHLDNLTIKVETAHPVFSTDLDPQSADVFRVTQSVLFPAGLVNEGSSFGDFFSEGGTLVPSDPLFFRQFEDLESTKINEARGYSVMPLDTAGSLSLEASFGNTIFLSNIGFYCDAYSMVKPWPSANFYPTLKGNPDECRRSYVARYGTVGRTAQVVDFPLIDGDPTFTLVSKTDGIELARFRTSKLAPKTILSGPEFNGSIYRETLSGGKLDELLRNVDLSPLQDLDDSNSTEFGLVSVPPEGLTIHDSSLYSDQTTENGTELVGLPNDGAQTGTYWVDYDPGMVSVSASGTTIGRTGTFPWIREHESRSANAPGVTFPTGLRSPTDVAARDSNLVAHSLEFVAGNSIRISGSQFESTGEILSDPFAEFSLSTDPQGSPLGYIRFAVPGGNLELESTNILANTAVQMEAAQTSIIGGRCTALHKIAIDGLADTQPDSLSVALIGTSKPNPPSTILNVPLNSDGEIRLDNLAAFAIANAEIEADTVFLRSLEIGERQVSVLNNVTIRSTRSARIYSNHELEISGRVTIENGLIAAPVITVQPGGYLEVTGESAAVFANLHQYGYGEFGALRIENGANPERNGRFTLASYHRRPAFDAPTRRKTLAPKLKIISAAGGTYQLQIGSSEAWQLSKNADWLEFERATGTGNEKIQVTIASNPLAQSREATISIDNVTHTIMQRAQEAFTEVTPSSHTIESTGGTYALSVLSTNIWMLEESEDWVEVSGFEGIGDAEIIVTVKENIQVTNRTATIRIDGVAHYLKQLAAPIIVSIGPEVHSIEASGAVYQIDVRANTEWRFGELPAWVDVQKLDGQAVITVLSNPTTIPRQGDIDFIGLSFSNSLSDRVVTHTLTQEAAAPITTLDSQDQKSNAEGSSYRIAITSNGDWSIDEDLDWVKVRSSDRPVGGKEDGWVTVITEPNNGIARAGAISVGGQIHILRQDGLHPIPLPSTDLLVWFKFDDSDTPGHAMDSISGQVRGIISGPSYVGGHSSEAGDRALLFAPQGGGVHISDAGFLNQAAAVDQLSVSFWQKTNATPNSSSFWFNSPNSKWNHRGVQAHVPWSDGSIYFDTAVCCEDGPGHRVVGNPAAEVNGDDFSWNDAQWHHYVFWKNAGLKKVYFDGVEFKSADGASPLPTDFLDGYIGGRGEGDGNPSAIIDDFAVFRTPLSEEQIGRLAKREATPGSLVGLTPVPKNSNTDLAFLAVTGVPHGPILAPIEPAFDPDTTNYEAHLPANVSSAAIQAAPADGSTGTTLVNGRPVGFDSTSGDFALVVGENLFEITVVAENGATKAYTLTVIRATPPKLHADLLVYLNLDDDETPDHVTDLVSGDDIGTINGPTYVDGRSGHPDDKALLFVQEGGPVYIADAGFMNQAAAVDKLSVVLWQKNNDTPNSSAFWFNSPASKWNNRGIQAHLPWSDGNIYYDTAICCDAETGHRISGDPTDIATGGDFAWNDSKWHHYVFWKDGVQKKIYIDGIEFKSGNDAAPLPDDFLDGYIGGRNTGDLNPSAVIDDFAVFKTSLTQKQITALANGVSPADL
jgi:hypothetical protein